jgi:glycine/D-amino acid oxidase-like deaminating enzyme
VVANVDLARRDGDHLRFSEPVTRWAPTPGGGLEVVTSRGRYGADRLVLASGAWVSTLHVRLGGRRRVRARPARRHLPGGAGLRLLARDLVAC